MAYHTPGSGLWELKKKATFPPKTVSSSNTCKIVNNGHILKNQTVLELYLTLLKRKNIMKNICQKLKNGLALL